MKKIFYYLIVSSLLFTLSQCKTLLSLPEISDKYSQDEAKRIIERVLNMQYKHTPTSVFVDDDCYKVSYASALLTGSIPNTRIVHRFIYYNDIGEMKLYKYPNCYNLVIYNLKGREINKVISKNLSDLQRMIKAIKSLQ